MHLGRKTYCCFFGGPKYVWEVCSVQETAFILEKGAVTSFSVLVGPQLLEKRVLLCFLLKPPSAVDRPTEETVT